MNWIYFSPHFDDIALSCGGLIWEQVRAGEQVSIWTICAGEQPPGSLSPFAEKLHTRWQTGPVATEQRRAEDIASCQRLGACHRHFSIPDAIYRRSEESGEFLYASNDTLMGPLNPAESALVARLTKEIAQSLPAQAALVSPLALGSHADHQLTRSAVEHLDRPLWYYADYPYVLLHGQALEQLTQAGWKAKRFPISQNGLTAWQNGIAAHASQISSFWPDLETMQSAIAQYAQENDGIKLWSAAGTTLIA
jgi:LmbE family N-acetylglucosaminyl deacetylase